MNKEQFKSFGNHYVVLGGFLADLSKLDTFNALEPIDFGIYDTDKCTNRYTIQSVMYDITRYMHTRGYNLIDSQIVSDYINYYQDSTISYNIRNIEGFLADYKSTIESAKRAKESRPEEYEHEWLTEYNRMVNSKKMREAMQQGKIIYDAWKGYPNGCNEDEYTCTTDDFDRWGKQLADIADNICIALHSLDDNLDMPIVTDLDNIPGIDDKVEQVVDNVIWDKTLNLITGAPKSNKSTMSMHMAYAISNGFDFLGLPTHKRDVVICDWELTPVQIRERTDAVKINLANKYDININDIVDPKFMVLKGIDAKFNLDYVISVLKAYAKTHPNPVFFLDCFYAFFDGENSNREDDVKKCVTKLKHLSRYGTVIYISHSNKTGIDLDNIFNATSGSGVHGRACDTQIVIQAYKPENNNVFDRNNRVVAFGGRSSAGDRILCRCDESTGYCVELTGRTSATNEELEQKYPALCSFIRANEKTPDDGVRYEKIREKFDFTEKQLVVMGFHSSGSAPRTDGVPLRKIFLPENEKGI